MPIHLRDAYGEQVRASGLLARPAGVERGDHVCWAYRDDAAFEDAALRFLAEGLTRGDRLLWVGDGAEHRLRRSSGPLADVDGLTARGTLRVLSVAEGYSAAGTAASGPLTPERQFAFYDAATRRAIDDGYRGLRVVAEITTLAADEEQRAQLLRWEHLADDYVAHGPGFSALCAYRGDLLPSDVVADVVALHPLAHDDGPATGFHLWFDEGVLRLSGDVDAFTAGRLTRLLTATHVDAQEVTLDLGGLAFIDLAGVRALASWAQSLTAADRRLVLRNASRLVRRMWELLGATGEATVPDSSGQR